MAEIEEPGKLKCPCTRCRLAEGTLFFENEPTVLYCLSCKKKLRKKKNREGKITISSHGSILHRDISKHRTLPVRTVTRYEDTGSIYEVISVEPAGKECYLITINEAGGNVTYRLPEQLNMWAIFTTSAGMSATMFPDKVEFRKQSNGIYFGTFLHKPDEDARFHDLSEARYNEIRRRGSMAMKLDLHDEEKVKEVIREPYELKKRFY